MMIAPHFSSHGPAQRPSLELPPAFQDDDDDDGDYHDEDDDDDVNDDNDDKTYDDDCSTCSAPLS